MEELLFELWNDTKAFYETVRMTESYDNYVGKKFNLFVERRVLENIWDQSRNDAENGRETIGTVGGFLKKIRLNGENYFKYYITSARRIQSGLSEKEIEEKYGCLAPLIAGEVEIENTIPFLENNTGVHHTHPLVTSIRYKGFRRSFQKEINLPADSNLIDKVNYYEITKKVRKARGYKICLLPFCVSTCYAEAKVVWDILFQHILPKYTSIENPVDIKRETFKRDVGSGILNHSVSARSMEEYLKLFYEAVTQKNYRKVVEAANSFVIRLNERGYTNETKLWGRDISTICEWVNNPILWKIAKEDAIKSGVLASYDLHLATANGRQSYRFPLYERKEDKRFGFRVYPTGVEYYGGMTYSQEVLNFKQAYKKKFKKDFRGVGSEVKESAKMKISLNTIPEIVEVFGYVNPAIGLAKVMRREEIKYQ